MSSAVSFFPFLAMLRILLVSALQFVLWLPLPSDFFTAASQCLTLAQLQELTSGKQARAAAGGRAAAVPPTAALRVLPDTEWTYKGAVAGTQDIYWVSYDPEASADKVPDFWLSLRPTQPTRDLVLKTTKATCVRQLQQELDKMKLHPEPVTCANCEGMRYQAETFNITIYSGKKGDYPFVVVLRRVSSNPGPLMAKP